MPIYEYQCNKCKKIIEHWHGLVSYDPKCDSCGSKDLKRIISKTTTRFGKDFYEEEYKKGSFDKTDF
tara:strand:+ start:280 stop:480 length:201 start_codon:yes stop_codon:yes gene_type:complete